ncbi:3-coathanger stack domain-containing protein [uncultured Arcticibacterium sp.]|uniref:3-coathanger stack domain-containing protein n=1 Tax=uncultured Arcticibacterium sp. TaxID=2173042 RepID=UPI0030F9DB25
MIYTRVKPLLSLLFLLFFPELNAQLLPEWGIALKDKEEYLTLKDVIDDGVGNYYAIGSYTNTEIDGSNFESQGGNRDVILMKLNANGDVLWKKRIGGDDYDYGQSISFYDGKVYVAALVRNGFNLNTPYQRGVNEQVLPEEVFSTLLVSYSEEGELLWTKLLDASIEVFPRALKATDKGLFLTGFFSGDTDFQSLSDSGGVTYSSAAFNRKGFLVRYDLDGNLIWANVLNSDTEVFVQDVAIYEDGLYVTGFYTGKLNTEGEAGSIMNISDSGIEVDNFLIKYDVNGSYVWLRRFGNRDSSEGMSVLARENQIFVSATYEGHINFNTPSLFNGVNELSTTEREAFIASYDSLGNLGWFNAFGPIYSGTTSKLKSVDNRLYINANTSIGDSLIFYTPDNSVAASYGLNSDHSNGLIASYLLSGTFLSCRIFESSEFSFLRAYQPTSEGLVTFNDIESELTISDLNQEIEDSLYSKSARLLQSHFVNELVPNWQNSYGDSQISGGYESMAIATDGFGNTYTTGYFHEEVKFGSLPVLYSQGGKDIFIIKQDSEGTPIWSRRAGGTGDDEPQDITFSDGYVYVTGSFENTANFSSPYSAGTNEITSAGGTDIFLWKGRQLDGYIFMLRRAGGVLDDIGKGIAVLNSEIFVTGKFMVTANFNTPSAIGSNQIASAGGTDAFLVKYSSSGDVNGIRRAGGTGDDAGISLSISNSDVYVGGFFEDTANFNTPSALGSNELVSAGLKDVFLAKYNSSGTLNYIRRGGGVDDDQLLDIATYKGNVYMTGFFTDEAFFPGVLLSGPALVSAGQRDAFLVKYSSGGIPMWRRRAGGTINDGGTSLAIENGTVNLVGFFRNTIDFNNFTEVWPETYLSDGLRDIFVTRFSTAGTLLSTKRAGGIGDDFPRGVAFDGYNSFLCGFGTEQMNFNTPSNNSTHFISPQGDPYAFMAAFLWTDKYHFSKIQGRETNGVIYTDDMVVDELGSSYIVGRYTDVINIGDLELQNSEEDKDCFFLLKLDASAKPLWLKEVAKATSANNAKLEYYEGQLFMHVSVDYDSLFIHSGASTLNVIGNHLLWFDTTGTYLSKVKVYEEVTDMAGAGGNIYLYGGFSDTLYFENAGVKDSLLISEDNRDAFLLNYNQNGNLNWAKRFGGENSDYGYKVEAFVNRIYISGTFKDSINFKTPSLYDTNKLYESAYEGVFLAALDLSGNLVWARRQDASFANDLNKSSLVPHDNGLYAINQTNSAIVNLSSPYQAGVDEYDALADGRIIVQSYDLTGQINWVKIIGDTSEYLYEEVYGTFLGGELVFGGENNKKINFSEPYVHGTMELSGGNSYLCSFNTSGDLRWYQGQGGIGNDVVNKLVSQGSSLYALTDISEFLESSNNSFKPKNNEKLAVIKFSPCGTISNLQSTAGDINLGYHFISGNNLTASNDITAQAEVEYKADAIVLEPGFSALSGTVFMAHPEGCN